jgi:hypothetical protein
MAASPPPGKAPALPPPDRAPAGLAEETRRTIFTELRRAEARAKREAVRLHPDGDANTARLNPEKEVRRAQKRLKLGSALEARYRREIADRYGLTDAQLEAIVREAAARRWPVPPEQGPTPVPTTVPER